MLTEISGVEEPPTDFTDAHRWLGYVGFSYGIHSKLGCVRGALGTAWVWQDAIPSYICVNPCYLWEDTVCFVGAAETAAPPEIASVLICAICGRLFHECGCVGMAGCHTLLQNFCVDLCHLWEALLCKKILCVPCVLWEDTVCFIGAAETAAPPELASVGGYFMNVGAWVWQDAIPSYDATPRGARR